MNYKTRQPFLNAAYVEGQRNFTYFDRSLTSGLADVVIESPGDFLYIDQASTGAVSVELNLRQGGTLAPILLAAGGSIECDFASFKLNASAQLNKSVRIIVGNGARIKGGANVNADSSTVNVTDGSLTRTLANEAFVGTTNNTATAAQQAHLQLWNPSTSGKNLYLPQFLVTVEAAQSLISATYNAAYADASTMVHSKKIGGNGPSGQLRSTTSVGALYSAYGIQIIFNAAGSYFHKFAEPIVIPPGYAFGLISGSPNTRVFFTPEWFEQ